MLNSSTKIRVNSPPTQLVSVWIRHEYFAARKRVEMPWTKSRKLDFDHSITSLIHPLTTLRQVKYRIKWLTKNSTTTIFYGINFSLKNRMNNCLNFPLFLSNDWGAPQSDLFTSKDTQIIKHQGFQETSWKRCFT